MVPIADGFAGNGATVTTQLSRDLGGIKPLLQIVGNEYSLFEGKLLILHHDLSLLPGRKNRGVSQITLTKLHREMRVALSI